MRKLTKIILPEVGVGDLKIRPRGDNRCESAKCTSLLRNSPSATLSTKKDKRTSRWLESGSGPHETTRGDAGDRST